MILTETINPRYVRMARHPTKPLRILNYTQVAQFEQHWDPVTLRCRGLVLDAENNIIVNPPPKFFNQGEPLAPDLDLSQCIISKKLDGYYISVTNSSQFGLIITSRGSFDNRYVEAAKRFILPKTKKLLPDISYFCELCMDFPGDEAIILTRHPRSGLFCWAIRDQNGKEYSPHIAPFPYVQQLTLKQSKRYLEQEVEGVVVFDPETQNRVKIKTEYYLINHRLIANCTRRKAWELLMSGKDLADYPMPDEYFLQMRNWQAEIEEQLEQRWREIMNAHSLTNRLSDKELGLLDDFHDEKPYLFLIRKHQELQARYNLLKALKPKLETIDSMV